MKIKLAHITDLTTHLRRYCSSVKQSPSDNRLEEG